MTSKNPAYQFPISTFQNVPHDEFVMLCDSLSDFIAQHDQWVGDKQIEVNDALIGTDYRGRKYPILLRYRFAESNLQGTTTQGSPRTLRSLNLGL